MSRFFIIALMIAALFGCMVGAASAAGDRYAVTEVTSCTLAGSRALCFTINTVDATNHITASSSAYAGSGVMDTKVVAGWANDVVFPGWFPWQGGSMTQSGATIGWRYQ